MYICDRCGREMNSSWVLLEPTDPESRTLYGGCCDLCGDNLCGECAQWSEDINDSGVCRQCLDKERGGAVWA